MSIDLFDLGLRADRRDRAFHHSPELFLHERAFEDVCERLQSVRRRFGSALMIGCPDQSWPGRLGAFAEQVQVADPGLRFAEAGGGSLIVEDQLELPAAALDLCVAVGTLDTVNDIVSTMRTIRQGLGEDALFIGALAGGESLPALRSAMRAADSVAGAAAAHVHPRVEAGALATLLSAAGFEMPVVDVDRVRLSYNGLADLVRDLRRMGATNVLSARPRSPILRRGYQAAAENFAGGGSPTIELIEILHFAAWTPSAAKQG